MKRVRGAEGLAKGGGPVHGDGMSGVEKRRDIRYRVRLRAVILKGKDEAVVQTEDISYRGLFLRTDTPPAVRSLIRIKVTLPPNGPDVTVHGMVVHVVEPGDPSRVPGAGVQFWGTFDPAQKKLWDELVSEQKRVAPEAPRRPVAVAHPPTLSSAAARDARPAEIDVKLAAVDELRTAYTQEISRGGMSVKTELDLPVSTAVRLRVVHPRTGETFVLEGIVRRRILRPGFRGLGIELTGMDQAKHAAFASFVAGEIPELGDEDVEVVA